MLAEMALTHDRLALARTSSRGPCIRRAAGRALVQC
jgi:hypothetical protein